MATSEDQTLGPMYDESAPFPAEMYDRPTPPPARGEEADPVRRAFDEIGRICEERWAGQEGWRTSIPARPDYDSDLILADGLKVAEQRLNAALARLTATEARLAEAEKRADAAVAIAREAGSHFMRLALRVETVEPTKAPAPSETAKATALAARLAQIGGKS